VYTQTILEGQAYLPATGTM